VFATGADVRIEGPAEIELVTAKRCVLNSGRLVASVPPSATGFVVDTPSAQLTDIGTEFGVVVRDDLTSDVQVFQGIVDGQSRGLREPVRITSGQGRRFRLDSVTQFDPHTDESPPVAPELPNGYATLSLTTATGKGKDAYVYNVEDQKHRSDILLLVKNQGTSPHGKLYDRKAYVGIDLSSFAGRQVIEASLTFTMDKTNMGFASEVPDSTFAVYGLTDESLDSWDESTLTWDTAPANRFGGAALDLSKVKKIGTFDVAQGVYSGTRSISDPALVDFLNSDTNQMATFILVRETQGSHRQSLVHGFANKRHPTLPPPTLKVTVARK
jgi:hypothetical protein